MKLRRNKYGPMRGSVRSCAKKRSMRAPFDVLKILSFREDIDNCDPRPKFRNF